MYLNKRRLIIISVFLLIFSLFYSYFTASWEITRYEYSTQVLLYKTATISMLTVFPKYCALMIVVAYALKRRFLKADIVVVLGLVTLALVNCLGSISDMGFKTALYSSYFPLLYLLVFSFYLGMDGDVWQTISRLSSAIVIIFLFLFLYEFLSSFMKYGWGIYQNASVVTYYSQLFWSAVVYIYYLVENRKQNKTIYIVLVILCIGAIILDSRSWLIQSSLLTVLTTFYLLKNSSRGYQGKIRSVFIILIVVIVTAFVVQSYFFSFLDAILLKGTTDNRSVQYVEIFEQTNMLQWIMGQGQNATYNSALYGAYGAIDNQFLFIAFHFGLITAILYFWNYLRTAVVCIKNRSRLENYLFCAGVIFMWVASLNGLSVFNGVALDVKCLIMPLLTGHIYVKATGRI